MRIFGNRIERKKGKWALWRWYDIELDGEPYLTRLQIVKTPWFSIKLHWIHRPDPDRDLHDHPWAFMSFVVRGGYQELESKAPARTGGKLRVVNSFNYKNTRTAHRITSVKPGTITLIISGPRVKKDWGFYNADTFEYTHWREYERQNG